MKYNTAVSAESARNRAFESGVSLMIVIMGNFFLVTTRKEAAKLEKKGYEVY